MAFFPNDLYLASGTGTVFNEWVPNVTKFTASSFYNWEQDNLPLYDLEDRTNLLWEKLGYPVKDGFSGIPGLMFAVSADAPFVGESSGIIFKSVSSVINTLPEVITIPIIIEVANFGNLGELNLNNLKFKGRGGLEIINRNFSKIKPTGDDGTTSKLVSVRILSSLDAFTTFHSASCVSISSLVMSSLITGRDSRIDGNNLTVMSRAYGYGLTDNPTSSIMVIRFASAIDGPSLFEDGAGAGVYNFSGGYNSGKDFTVSSYDIIPYNELTDTVNASNMRRSTVGTAAPIAGIMYNNWFTKVKIKNCNGPIYIRGFAVDGGNGYSTTLVHTTDNGYEVENSKVVIEDALATRCKNTGFRLVNSDIVLSRTINAIRNYTLTDYQTRSDFNSVGIKVLNSNIIVSSLHTNSSGTNSTINSTWNKIGIELFNSRWTGGENRKNYTNTSSISHIRTCYNNLDGIKLNNSYMEIPGRLDTFNNNKGAYLNNSELKINEGTFEFNQDYGLHSENSHVVYNYDLHKYTQLNAIEPEGQVQFQGNSVNMLLDKSDFNFEEGNSLNASCGTFYVYQSFGVYKDPNGLKTSLPNIQVFNGSNLRVYKPYVYNRQTNLAVTLPIYGILASVKNNSKATFIGSKDGAGIFIGPQNYTQQIHLAGLYADNASILELQGPTLICNTGIGILAENQSIINLSPPKDTFGNLLTSSFDLSSAQNHSKIEIHSTRACIVANKNSIINMTDLGSYNAFWPASQTSSTDYNLNDAQGISFATSGGYLQFYPNGQEPTVIAQSAGRSDIDSAYPSFIASPVLGANNQLLIQTLDADHSLDISGISTGGMCVRVMNGSIVNVKNVHFPCGWENTSGILYDASGGACDRLRIWNIGADSEMEASYITVSSQYPSLAGYYGPSAVYVSGGAAASSAPSWVPDTGIVSVLDSYGTSGSTVGTNYGPFRIYVGVDGPSKFLNYYTSALIYNSAYQTYSQGYNPSGALSSAPDVSAYYRNLTTSTFLTTSAVIDPGYRSRIRLDESAADTFANAKNGAISKSGRVPFCTIYRSRSTEGSESFGTTATGHGLGLLSVNIFDLSRVN